MEKSKQMIEAVKSGNLAAIRKLLKEDPQLIHACTDRGESVMMLAVYYGQKEVAQLLLSKATALTIFEATALGQKQRVIDLLRSNAELLHTFSDDGWTAVHLAAFFGHTEILRYLLDAGGKIDVAAKNEMAVLPLHSAIANRRFDTAELLIASGADVNAVQSADWTPLHYAAAVGNAQLVERLLQTGADRAAKNNSGQTALDVADEKGHTIVAELLKNKGDFR